MMTGGPADQHPSSRPARLRRRGDFVRAAKQGTRASSALFTIQMATQDSAVPDSAVQNSAVSPPRFGFTVTKKVAGAVGRNRIRRRLREALRLTLRDAAAEASGRRLGARQGRDYVFVARRPALNAPFAQIIAHMTEGFARLDRGAASASPNRKDRPSAS